MNRFTDDDLARLNRFADDLIPAGSVLPSASEVGVFGRLYDIALQFNSDIDATFISLLAFDDMSMDEIKKTDPTLCERAAETLAAIYFMDTGVREVIHFPGRIPRPARTDVEDFTEILLPVYENISGPREA